MQVGVIVAGVLASGLWHKFTTDSRLAMPFPVSIIYHYGTIGFAIPLIWIICALLLRRRDNVSDDVKSLAFWFGVVILITLATFMIYANVTPCFQISGGMNGDENS